MASSSPAGSSPSAVADVVLAAPGYRARLRKLQESEPHFRPELADVLLARAGNEIRQDPRMSAQMARLAGHVAVAIQDGPRRIAALRSRAEAAIVGGTYRTALTALDEASSLLQRDGDDALAIEIDALGMQTLTHLERYEEASEIGQRALRALEQKHDLPGRIRVLMALADLAYRLDRPREALRRHAEVEDLLPADGLPRVHAALAVNRANALEACNRFRAASRHFERAREIFEAEGCDHTVAQVEYNTAYAEALRGRYQDALRRYARAEDAFLRFGDDRHLAHVNLDRAEIHLHFHLPEDVEELAAKAEAGFDALGLVKEGAQAAHLAGRAAELVGQSEKAEACYRRAAAVYDDLGLTERRAGCLLQLAQLAARAERMEDAQRLAGEAAHLLGKTSNPLSRASLGLLEARLALLADRSDEAVARAEAVLALCQRIHVPWIRVEAHRVAGQAHVRQARTEKAIRAYKHALDDFERHRGGVPPDEYMAAFLAGHSGLYAEIIDLLVVADRPDEAFEYTERAKSRALVDLLAGRHDHDTTPKESALSAARVQNLRERLTAVYRRLFHHNGESDARSARAVREALTQARALEDDLAKTIRNARMRDPQAFTLDAVDAPDLHAVRRDLGQDTILLEYFCTAKSLYVFVVTPSEIHVVKHDQGENVIRRGLERFHFHLAKYARPHVAAEDLVLRATRANLRDLAAILLDPVADRLRGRRILIVPHGVLHHLPFHALPWGEDGWLSDRFEIVYAPSAAVYGFCRNQGPSAGGAACVFGLPDEFAPSIEDEARRVARVLGTDHLYLGEKATLDSLRNEASRARVVHIATHGMFRHTNPMLSAIRLADGWVNIYDVYGLAMRGEIVVLSTCESGTADVTDGNEILGLTRGFLYAGTPVLLTSQWRVHDAVTTEFMDSFYRNLEQPRDAAAAHKAAMAEIRTRHPHPYFWAPFFLTGRPLPIPSQAPTRTVAPARASSTCMEQPTPVQGERNL